MKGGGGPSAERGGEGAPEAKKKSGALEKVAAAERLEKRKTGASWWPVEAFSRAGSGQLAAAAKKKESEQNKKKRSHDSNCGDYMVRT